MKAFNTLLKFSLAILLLANCKSSNLKEPEQVGQLVFNLLKNISIDTKKAYTDKFITANDLQRIVNKHNIAEEITVTQDELTSEIESEYNEIKAKGIKYSINWQKIEYLDFIYSTSTYEGILNLEGKLYFKYDDETYIVDVKSIFSGKEYKLYSIDYLRYN
ncbi:MAG: hypothetical protein PHY55_06320 [Bacteroidales bacterium]|nr:hypothetical protein [Bacteroidales bacterium]